MTTTHVPPAALEAPAMTTASPERPATAAMLRAVAGLIETRPDVPAPSTRIDFYLDGPDAPALMATIATALPCGWRARISDSGTSEWLNLDSDLPGSSVTRGARVHIAAPTADACVRAGTKTVTVWQPAPALAGLLGSQPVSEAER